MREVKFNINVTGHLDACEGDRIVQTAPIQIVVEEFTKEAFDKVWEQLSQGRETLIGAPE